MESGKELEHSTGRYVASLIAGCGHPENVRECCQPMVVTLCSLWHNALECMFIILSHKLGWDLDRICAGIWSMHSTWKHMLREFQFMKTLC